METRGGAGGEIVGGVAGEGLVFGRSVRDFGDVKTVETEGHAGEDDEGDDGDGNRTDGPGRERVSE